MDAVEEKKENITPPTQAPLPAPPQHVARIQHPVLLGLNLLSLCLFAAFALIAWQWHGQLESKHLHNSTQISKALQQQSLSIANASAVEQIRSENTRLKDQVHGLSENLNYHAQQLAQMSGGNRNDWLLSEAEYLLRLANQRLNLEHDIDGSELILSAADSVLKEIDDPALLAARVAVAEELLALQSLATADTQGAQAKLRALMKVIPQLPERDQSESPTTTNRQEPRTEPNDTSIHWSDQLLNTLHQAVKIQRLDQPVAPLLPPEQKYYLQHNLRLMYERSSLALVQRDNLSFQGSLEQAEQWLTDFFATTDPLVQTQLSAIEELKAFQLGGETPDISKSLRLVKSRIEAMYRNHQLSPQTSAINKVEASAP